MIAVRKMTAKQLERAGAAIDAAWRAGELGTVTLTFSSEGLASVASAIDASPRDLLYLFEWHASTIAHAKKTTPAPAAAAATSPRRRA